MTYTVTTPWTVKKQPCEARIAPNCSKAGPTRKTVNGSPACGPCGTYASNANKAADRRRG